MTLQYLEPESDDFGLAEQKLLVDRPVPVFEQHGLMAEEAPVEAWHWSKACLGKTAQPINRGAHVDMRRLVKVIRRRGEKDAGRRGGHGSDRPQCQLLRHVLEDFDAGHEVVVIGQGIADRANLAIWPQVRPNARNGKARDIAAISLYTAIPKCLDKKTMGAPGVKNAGWTYGANQLVGGPRRARSRNL